MLPAGAEQRVLIIPGYLTSAAHLQIMDKQRQQQHAQQEEQRLPPCPFFRVSFASVDAQTMVEGFARLRAAIDSKLDPS
jgi:DNA-binding transcriptional MocR family regulator